MDPTFQALMAAVSAVPLFGPLLPYVPLVCLIASIVDLAIPQPALGSRWAPARAVLHILSLGVLHARPGVPGVPAAVAAQAAEVKSIAADVAEAAGELSATAATPVPASQVPAATLGALVGMLFLLGLSACSGDQVNQAVAEGQLVCTQGPAFAALFDPSGAAVLAKGSSKAFVDAACALVGGVAVSPPGALVRTVTIVPPPVTIRLRTAS